MKTGWWVLAPWCSVQLKDFCNGTYLRIPVARPAFVKSGHRCLIGFEKSYKPSYQGVMSEGSAQHCHLCLWLTVSTVYFLSPLNPEHLESTGWFFFPPHLSWAFPCPDLIVIHLCPAMLVFVFVLIFVSIKSLVKNGIHNVHHSRL